MIADSAYIHMRSKKRMGHTFVKQHCDPGMPKCRASVAVSLLRTLDPESIHTVAGPKFIIEKKPLSRLSSIATIRSNRNHNHGQNEDAIIHIKHSSISHHHSITCNTFLIDKHAYKGLGRCSRGNFFCKLKLSHSFRFNYNVYVIQYHLKRFEKRFARPGND